MSILIFFLEKQNLPEFDKMFCFSWHNFLNWEIIKYSLHKNSKKNQGVKEFHMMVRVHIPHHYPYIALSQNMLPPSIDEY